jgi:hypothetical protein
MAMGGDEFASADDAGVSPHAAGNLDYALGDEAMKAFMQIEKDPMGYYRHFGEDAARYANKIAATIANVDDQTLDLMAKSPMVQRAIEDNFNPDGDIQHIPLDVMMQIVQKVEARG